MSTKYTKSKKPNRKAKKTPKRKRKAASKTKKQRNRSPQMLQKNLTVNSILDLVGEFTFQEEQSHNDVEGVDAATKLFVILCLFYIGMAEMAKKKQKPSKAKK
ncbi:hypothetical protein AVEN_138469-1 [Araneus ventricosus]|uniref:Uncharacterized protein n=1 Tax=Araneus ventricosus TaxID=182803 RepID=A0A4Y2CD83_ARAVE|nr:hypothetical protein AVEN_138469-1 [Araneus ventricosus]